MNKMCSVKTMCVFSVFLATTFLWRTVAGINFYKFRSNPVFDGYRCSRDKTIFQTLASNILQCTDTCHMDSFCYSFSYQQETGICVGCSGFYHNSEILKGSRYFGRYSSKCPPGWMKVMEQCYYVSSNQTKLNMTDAMIECARLGGRLFELQFVRQYEFLLVSGFYKSLAFWVGLKYNHEKRKYLWLSNGIPEDPFHPDRYLAQTNGSDCAVYKIAAVHETECHDEHSFICEHTIVENTLQRWLVDGFTKEEFSTFVLIKQNGQ